ncbi:hypothetical protein B7494_g5843 [Chlorociboria aeruginascens]|nr:hypothetical protein B7494_g5843 [Chlorociboria aeruginascens]
MGLTEIRNICPVDLNTPAEKQPKLHNRWHPDIPFADTVKNGETVKIECVDWTGGQIGNNNSADDVKNVDLTKIHYLSGPFEIEDAMPGVFDKNNGGGFLDELYPSAAKAIWDFEGIYYPGILGCAPSAEILATWNKREGELIAANKLDRIVAQPPNAQNTHAGSASEEVKANVAREGARTIPGDGEISFCGAIEMSGVITINFKVVKNGMADLGMKSPLYLPDKILMCTGPVEPHYGPGRYLTFEGFSVDEHGKQHYMATLTKTVTFIETNRIIGRNSCISTNYTPRFGYSDYQVYLLLSCAPVQGHVAGIVDIPNACTTLGLPMDIFDFDISPSGPAKKLDLGVKEGKVTAGGANSEHSFGGGLTFKEKNTVAKNLTQKVIGS